MSKNLNVDKFRNGGRDSKGIFSMIDEAGGFYSATEQTSANAWARQLVSGSGYIFRVSGNKAAGFSVPCIKD